VILSRSPARVFAALSSDKPLAKVEELIMQNPNSLRFGVMLAPLLLAWPVSFPSLVVSQNKRQAVRDMCRLKKCSR
jgi:hypothetical protein